MHLSIQRKKVTASSVTRSGVGMPDPWADSNLAHKPAPATTPTTAKEPEIEIPDLKADPLAAEMIQPVSDEEAAEGGFGVFLKQQANPVPEPVPASEKPPVEDKPAELPAAISEKVEEAKTEREPVAETPPAASVVAPVPTARRTGPLPPRDADDEGASVVKRPQSNSPPPTPAPAPMSASTLQKMKSEGMYRNQYFKDADCFECDHSFKVSRSTRSTHCPSCGALIALDDVEVNMPSGDSIKTRGDVLIRKRGQVSAESIMCKDLRCQGILEANVKASGDAIFRATGNMIGEVHCRRFIIEKGSDVVFLNGIHAEEVEVQARVTATIFSSGSLVIGPNGSVNGDVTARSVSIEPGGEINGAMNIVRK
ncbi:cytoskeletal protein CcmA (bactofilin family) [Prosthecobacter fusiformis]|uniref:Cytoskeletal protein CcmA (Bactofilin family) n=1 Tax=Prosthecobacter fusiformis TaxID=48464 RepID=A0A4R7S6H9_9BACT|nr:polymer-forming cytoskeletal protein [Prosthecobacter fusiformis]TDU73168.1 cytoskeletal protein CcmA (bactofilin family) [Prosthecobacter fusiformis]